MNVDFFPDDEAKVHTLGAISIICSAFRSHEDGLPEWVKNSSDAYTRREVAPQQRVIVLLLKDGRNGQAAAVACLDFGGIDVRDIEGKFRQWADPSAAGPEAGVQGGHGNGGKCYMTQLFSDYSYLQSVFKGRGNRYGFKGGDPVPGYFPSKEKGRDYLVTNPEGELQEALRVFGIGLTDLPEAAQAAWLTRQSFTLVVGIGAKHLAKGRVPAREWIGAIAGDSEMVLPLQRNSVYVLHNRQPHVDANPLTLPEIEPIPGAEAPRVVQLPDELPDPATGDAVSTGAVKDVSLLQLRTSEKSMQGFKRRTRHAIFGWTHDNRATGFWEVTALSTAAYANKIYGDLFLEALKEYKQNDRRNHSEAPLTRALRAWIQQQINLYSAEFEELDRLHATKEQQDELSHLNQALNDWKNAFLEQEFGGSGETTKGNGGGAKERKPLPRAPVSSVVLEISHQMAGQGVAFQPTVKFFDATGTRVRPVLHEWVASDRAVASFDRSLNMLVTGKPGRSSLTVVCKESGVESNTVEIEVLGIATIAVAPKALELPAGSCSPLTATVVTEDGREVQGVYLIWTEGDRSVVSVGASGMVYGLVPGSSIVTAGDDAAEVAEPCTVEVVQREEAGQKGSGFPQILLSEIDNDPLGEVPPKFTSADPPVYQRPQDVDANIWWINMASPLARRYIDAAKGGAKNPEWRVYLLERYIEIMVKIVLTYDYSHGETLTFETMLRRWEEEAALMQQRAVESLANFLAGGEVEIETS